MFFFIQKHSLFQNSLFWSVWHHQVSIYYLADNIRVSGKSLRQWYLLSVLSAYVLPQHRIIFKEQMFPVHFVLYAQDYTSYQTSSVYVYSIMKLLWECIIFTSPKQFLIGIISPELWCCGKTTYFPLLNQWSEKLISKLKFIPKLERNLFWITVSIVGFEHILGIICHNCLQNTTNTNYIPKMCN